MLEGKTGMTKTKRLTYLLLVATLISVSLGLMASRAALAARMERPNLVPAADRLSSVHSGVLAAGKYSYIVAFSDDDQNPQNMQDPSNGASFNASVPKVVAWLGIKRNDATAPATQFSVQIQFQSPKGVTINSDFTNGKNSITPGNQQYDQDSIVSNFIKVNGTSNAKSLGTWSVVFTVGGQDLDTESFTLVKAGAPTDNGTPVSATTPTVTSGDASACSQTGSSNDPVTQVHSCLESQNYDVLDTSQTTMKNGQKVAYVLSDMADANKDFYSSDTAQQLFSTFQVLANAWPDSDALLSEMAFSQEYTILTIANMSDWQTFLKAFNPNDQTATAQAWQTFSGNLSISIYDNTTQQMLTPQQTKDFATKNFGSSSSGNSGTDNSGNDSGIPIGDPTHPANSNVSRVSISADTISLPPDGTSTSVITVKVYDRQSRPLASQEVSFSLSGTGGGKLKPTSTSTDNTGVAQTTYTAGKKQGQVTIVATSGGVRGSATISLSTSDVPQTNTGDPASAVQTDLESKGYQVLSAGPLQSDATTFYVAMPRASSSIDDNLVKQILNGWSSLASNYSNAKNLLVVTTFQVQGTNYGVLWLISSTDFATLVADVNDGSTAKITDAQNILSKALSNAQAVNLDTGEAVSNSGDFVNKNFGGG